MILPIVAVLLGLGVLVWSADKFVDGAVGVARFCGMSTLLIGMVVVGFGTSAPEMVVSALSAMQNAPELALGNAYGVQILRTMEKDFDVFSAIREGRLTAIRDWLIEHVFSIASLSTPDEWIRAVTGEGLNPDYYLDYLEAKFSEVYGLK